MDKLAQQFHPQVQGTFLNRLATNLPPALAGGAGSPTFAGGLGGAFQGIQEQQRYQQQQADLQQQRSLQMQQFQLQNQQYATQQSNANRDYQLSLQRENRLAAAPDNKTLVRPPAGVAGPIQAFDPVKGTLSLVSSPYQQGAGPLASQGQAWQNASPPKYIGSYTNAENKRVNQYQLPDGSMQETVGDEVYHAPVKEASNLAATRDARKAVIGYDANNRPVLLPAGDAEKANLTNVMDAPNADVQSAMDARSFMSVLNKQGKEPSQMGVMQLINSLEKDGKLGVAASRVNSFLAGNVGAAPGDDPRIMALLDKANLAMTLSMKAHFGASGGRSPQMLQHFLDMANAKTMNAATLRSGFAAVGDYMDGRAMMPSSDGATGGAPQPTRRKVSLIPTN